MSVQQINIFPDMSKLNPVISMEQYQFVKSKPGSRCKSFTSVSYVYYVEFSLYHSNGFKFLQSEFIFYFPYT